jgi:hypothetical protein
MQTTTFLNSTMGLELPVQVPATLADAAEAFGAENVYRASLLYGFYQKWNSAFRKALVKKLEETTGIKRRQQVKGGNPVFRTNAKGEKTEVPESENTYVQFLLSEESGSGLTEADYEAIGTEVAGGIAFDLDVSSESKPSKEFYAAAKKKLAQVAAGETSEEAFTANFESLNPGYTLEALGGFTEDGLAKAFKINHERAAALAASAL